MPSDQVVFIHHKRHGGKLSRADTIRVWTHVSQRSRREPSKQLAFRDWEPPETSRKKLERGVSGRRNNALASSKESHQAYTFQVRLEMPIKPPEDLRLFEVTLSAMSEQILKVKMRKMTVHYIPMEQHQISATAIDLAMVGYVIEYGVDYLTSHNLSQAFACFENALQVIKRILSRDMIDNLEGILPDILTSLAYAMSCHAHDVALLFLKQIYALAVISGGPMHPIAIYTRNLLTVGMTPELIEKLALAELDLRHANNTLSRSTLESRKMEYKRLILGRNYPLDDAERDHSRVMNAILSPLDGRWRYLCQFACARMAAIYIDHHCFVDAASLLSGAHEELQEYLENGYTHNLITPSPLSMMAIVWQLELLGQAQAGQEEHDLARATFRLAVDAGERHLKPGHATRIKAQKTYAKYLFSQKQDMEAARIEQHVNLELSAYMLAP